MIDDEEYKPVEPDPFTLGETQKDDFFAGIERPQPQMKAEIVEKVTQKIAQRTHVLDSFIRKYPFKPEEQKGSNGKQFFNIILHGVRIIREYDSISGTEVNEVSLSKEDLEQDPQKFLSSTGFSFGSYRENLSRDSGNPSYENIHVDFNIHIEKAMDPELAADLEKSNDVLKDDVFTMYQISPKEIEKSINQIPLDIPKKYKAEVTEDGDYKKVTLPMRASDFEVVEIILDIFEQKLGINFKF